MCGIYGIIYSDQRQVTGSMLESFGDQMIHRGPDDSGHYISGSCGIGMRRLSIIDLAGGHQPISNHENTVHVVLNGEIYNYQELRKSLINKGYQFKTESDVEVLVHLYEEYGREAIQKLNGMFAFALFDESKGEIWIARDRLGIKPLFYCFQGSSFTFSSELKSIAKFTDASLDKDSIVSYLGYSYVPSPQSIFKQIKKLNPGQEMVFKLDRFNFSLNQYWKLQDYEPKKATINELSEELTDLIEDATRLQMISDVPLGLFLSGGVDSSAIASFASDLTGDIPLETFTINFENKEGQDANFAREISHSLSTTHHEFNLSANDQLDALNNLMPFIDEPMSDSAIVPTFMLSKKAREYGMKVLLSGAGGDEIFGGYPRHFPGKVGTAAWFSNLPSPLRTSASLILGLYNSTLRTRINNPARNFLVNISGVNFSFLSEALHDQNDYKQLIKKIDSDYSDAHTKSSYPLMKMDLADYLPNNILMLTDKATMAASVEGRVPLLDHRIVEFAFSLKENMNIYQGNQKGLFKYSLKNRLSHELLFREKEGFNAPVHSWVQYWPEIIKTELLDQCSNQMSEIIDTDVIEKWVANPSARRKAGSSIYALFILNKWLNEL